MLQGSALAIVQVLSLLIGGVMVLVAWNVVMPAVFGLPTLDYAQAFALNLLASVVTGRIGHIRVTMQEGR